MYEWLMFLSNNRTILLAMQGFQMIPLPTLFLLLFLSIIPPAPIELVPTFPFLIAFILHMSLLCSRTLASAMGIHEAMYQQV